MPVVSPLVLHAAARLLELPLARRATRRAMFALSSRALPVVAVEWYAARAPSGAADADASPFVTRFEPEGDAPSIAGPLAGDAVVVKDALDVGGAMTTLGLAGGERAGDDAELVRRIRAAGGFILGKTKMTELGMDGLGALMPGPMPENPRAPRHFAGGSSTGTAVAIASGLARYGVGGDGLGSVRIPAAYAGLVGLKPGRDRLSMRGYRSVAPTMDVPGPMARDVADCARLFQVLAGEEVSPLDARAPARVGVIRGLGPELATRDVARAFARVLDAIGAERVDVEVPGAPHHAVLGVAAATRELAESAHASRALSAQGRVNVALGRSFRGDGEWIDARRVALRDAALRAIDRAGFLAMPTTAIPAPAIRRGLLEGGEDALLLRAVGCYTPFANLAGLPAIAVPCGVDARGRPLSIMLMGAPESELDLLRAALAIEATGLARAPV